MSDDATAFGGMFNILWYELNDHMYTFLGVEFCLIDLIYYSAIVAVFGFFIKQVIMFWRVHYGD